MTNRLSRWLRMTGMTTSSPGRRKHLLSDDQIGSHAGVSADELGRSHRHGNGMRVHRTYMLVFSLATLVMLVVVIAVASATM